MQQLFCLILCVLARSVVFPKSNPLAMVVLESKEARPSPFLAVLEHTHTLSTQNPL